MGMIAAVIGAVLFWPMLNGPVGAGQVVQGVTTGNCHRITRSVTHYRCWVRLGDGRSAFFLSDRQMDSGVIKKFVRRERRLLGQTYTEL